MLGAAASIVLSCAPSMARCAAAAGDSTSKKACPLGAEAESILLLLFGPPANVSAPRMSPVRPSDGHRPAGRVSNRTDSPGTPPIPPVVTPEERTRRLFDRARRILVLRRLLKLGFTAGDSAEALHLLRIYRDIHTSMQDAPEKALDEEYRELLEAEPGDTLPPSSIPLMENIERGIREAQIKIGSSLGVTLGRSKAEGLMAMIEDDGLRRLTVFGGLIFDPGSKTEGSSGPYATAPRDDGSPAPVVVHIPVSQMIEILEDRLDVQKRRPIGPKSGG